MAEPIVPFRLRRAQAGVIKKVVEFGAQQAGVLLEIGPDVVNGSRPQGRMVAFGDFLLPMVADDGERDVSRSGVEAEPGHDGEEREA